MIPFEFRPEDAANKPDHTVVVPRGLDNKAALFTFFRQALSLPEYFGGNWDAFEECLSDLSWSTHPVITLVHHDIPFQNNPSDKRTYLEILALAVRESRRLQVIFPSHDRPEIERLISGME